MILRAVLIVLAIVTLIALGLFWDHARISNKLEITEERLEAAEFDAAAKAEAIGILQKHIGKLSDLDASMRRAESAIRSSEGYDDEVPAIILSTITDLGM